MDDEESRQVIGMENVRHDVRDKVQGRTVYGSDVSLPGQLYAAMKKSIYPHAKIISIDISKAKAVPGVRAVITGKDYPFHFGGFLEDQPILAIDKVRYWGEPVAAVAADDLRTAEAAARLIDVVYEELPVVDSIETALKAETLLHDDWNAYEKKGNCHPIEHSNVVDRFVLKHGDIEKGFAEADVIVESEFRCGMLQHTVMEPHSAVAVADEDHIRVYTPCQSPFAVRSQIASCFHYPLDKVRLTCTEIGGAFGCKAEAKAEPLAIALALETKRPVKLVYTRDDEFATSLARAGVLYKIKSGAKKDGTIVALQNLVYWDTGAYATFGPRVNYNAGYAATGPYHIPNVLIDSYCVETNKALGSAYRGFGVAEAACGYERQMDRVAEKLGMDPLELRLKNVLRDGMESPSGEVMKAVGVGECLEKAAAEIGWKDRPHRWVTEDGKLHGLGIACFTKISGTPSTTSCTLRMNYDGTITLNSASREMGQGVTTTLPILAAQSLGIKVENIIMADVDTDITPFDKTTTSSRSTFHGGNAVLAAAEDIKKQLRKLAAVKWKIDFDNTDYVNGRIINKLDESLSIDVNEVGKSGIMVEQEPVIAVGKYGTSDIFDPPVQETHQSKRPTVMWMMGANAAEVEVDPKTGKTRIVKIAAANDVGKVIYPLGCKQQIEGGVNMAAGSALLEEMIYENGILRNGNMVDYKVPTFMDSDFETKVILVEVPHAEGPYGAKGLGEPGTAPTAPAIVNAVSTACNTDIKSIPIKPERIILGQEG